MKSNIFNVVLWLVLAAAILFFVNTKSPPPKETVIHYGPNYRLIKRPEARGAERWIFQRMVGTNEQVITEGLVEGGEMKAAMHYAAFVWGWCGTKHGDSAYFQNGSLGADISFTRIEISQESAVINGIQTTKANAASFMNRISAAGGKFIITHSFDCPANAQSIERLFAWAASNKAPWIVFIPNNRWRSPFQTEFKLDSVTPLRNP